MQIVCQACRGVHFCEARASGGAAAGHVTDPSVMFYLLPMPAGSAGRGRATEDDDGPPAKRPKAKAKGKAKAKAAATMPSELEGINGLPGMCWGYNSPKRGCRWAKPNESCRAGKHACMRCGADHPQHRCPKKDESSTQQKKE